MLRAARPYGSSTQITVEVDGVPHQAMVASTGGWQAWADTPVDGVVLSAGEHRIRVRFHSGGINFNHLRFVATDGEPDPDPDPEPGTAPTHDNGGQPWSVADGTTIEAEDFDTSGAGVAYSDNDPDNRGGKYRDTGVDIEDTADDGGGHNVGWIAGGEWLAYTIDATTTDTWDLGLRIARSYGSPGAATVEVGGASHPIDIPSTGGWQTWHTVWLRGVSIPAGTGVLRVRMGSSGFNFNRIEIAAADAGTPAPTYGNDQAPWPLGGTLALEAEDYDTDGAGAAFTDSTAGNSGGKYRSDDVDIEETQDGGGGHNVGWIAGGEWLAFTVEGDSDAIYDVTARTARAYGSDARIEVEVAGETLAAPVPGSGGWQSWTDTPVGSVAIPAGRHRLIVRFPVGGWNLNRLVLEALPSASQ